MFRDESRLWIDLVVVFRDDSLLWPCVNPLFLTGNLYGTSNKIVKDQVLHGQKSGPICAILRDCGISFQNDSDCFLGNYLHMIVVLDLALGVLHQTDEERQAMIATVMA